MDMFSSLNDVSDFYYAYVYKLFCTPNGGFIGDDSELNNLYLEMEFNLLDLSACKIDVDASFAPEFGMFKYETLGYYRKWLNAMKKEAFIAGIPLRAELLDLIHDDCNVLRLSAEIEAEGDSDGRLHPDIYMNELLVGMRMIRQVLPVIMEKLGIEFKETT